MRESYPINVLKRIQDVPEVCSIYLCHGQSCAGGGGRRCQRRLKIPQKRRLKIPQ